MNSRFDEMTKFTTPKKKITIDSIPEGKILDIGGGGEGIIARIGGKRITAVDKQKGEIEEAKPFAPEATWIQADAAELDFEAEVFDNATAFFSGMYMTNVEKANVFQEVHRLIPPGGELWLWDADIDCKEELFIIYLDIELSNKELIETGYGVKAKKQNPEIYEKILSEIGFEVKIEHSEDYWFFIKAKKVD